MLGRLVESGHIRSLEAYLRDRTPSENQRFDPEKDLFPGWWRATSWYRNKPYAYPFLARVMSIWRLESILKGKAKLRYPPK